MPTLRRGTALFNTLLGFPEPTPAPLPDAPLEAMYEWQAHKAGLLRELKLQLDDKLFEISFWPRPESPFYHSFDNQRMLAMGYKFFDFKVRVDVENTWTMQGCKVWFPQSNGSMEMQIINYMLACASDWRSHTLQEFAESWGEDAANDYIELRWRFCQRCEQFFFRIGLTADAQCEMRDDLENMCVHEGPWEY